MKRVAIVLAMATMLSTPAQSQGDVQTQGSWKRMNKAVFDWAEVSSTATADDRAILQMLWAQELAARHKTPTGYLPGFALIGDVREGSKRIVFSMFSAGGVDSCEPAANGAAAQDIFEVCRLRVASLQAQQGNSSLIVDLPGYCMIAGSSSTNGWIEYRYDKLAQIVHFRTFQFGKVVTDCSRSLKLG